MTTGLRAWTALLAMCALLTCHVTLAQDDDQVLEPPEIKKPVKAETIYIVDRRAHTIECHAEGKPTPTYQWKRNGEIITPNKELSVVSKTGELVFSEFNRMYEGEYMCVATNNYRGADMTWRKAVSLSPPIMVLERIVQDFLKETSVILDGKEYEYLMLECRDKGLIQTPVINFNWYKGEKSSQVLPDNNRLFVDSSGNLHITYLLKKDENLVTGREYRCGVTNTVSSIVLGSPTQVTVKETQSAGAIKPQFQYSNSGEKALLFSDAELQCFFSGYDPEAEFGLPKVKWFDDANNELPGTSEENKKKYSISADGRQLTIKNVQEEDERNFFCQAETSRDETDKQTVLLDVTSPPIFYSPIPDQTKPEHSHAVFDCKARSLSGETPPSPPTWLINGVESGTHNDPSKYQFSDDKWSLKIMKLSKETDILCVQCKVTNQVGSVWGDGCLNVILGIEVTNDPVYRHEIQKGDLVNLTVISTTDPSQTLTYNWEFRNTSGLPRFVTYKPTSKEAFINTSALSQSQYQEIGGVYTLTLKNPYDEKQLEFEVILKDRPVIGPVVSKGGIDMWIIGLIIGILFLIIVIIIIIFVVCRKKQEGDYNVDKKETGAGLDPEKELKEKGFDDYSRPTYDDYEYPDKKPRGELEYDDVPIGGDDESLAEYGDEADTHFNEDGSFIGVYQNNRGPKGQSRSTESTI